MSNGSNSNKVEQYKAPKTIQNYIKLLRKTSKNYKHSTAEVNRHTTWRYTNSFITTIIIVNQHSNTKK